MPKFNKKKVLERIVPTPKTAKRAFWAREMKILNSLMSMYSSENFWQKVSFSQSFDSLAYLLSPFGKNLLRKKFNEFNFKIQNKPKPKLEDKKGEDSSVKKAKLNIKDHF